VKGRLMARHGLLVRNCQDLWIGVSRGLLIAS
jgi:hypothetical protein